MNKYDKNSLKAEEFINDGEILDSLKFDRMKIKITLNLSIK